jgi:hypothetical protein
MLNRGPFLSMFSVTIRAEFRAYPSEAVNYCGAHLGPKRSRVAPRWPAILALADRWREDRARGSTACAANTSVVRLSRLEWGGSRLYWMCHLSISLRASPSETKTCRLSHFSRNRALNSRCPRDRLRKIVAVRRVPKPTDRAPSCAIGDRYRPECPAAAHAWCSVAPAL